MRRKMMVGCLGALMLVPVLLADGPVSNTEFVYLQPKTSSFWRTAPGAVINVPVEMPIHAKTASLTVVGNNYVRQYDDVSAGLFAFAVPEPVDPKSENVYDLSLRFDDGTVRSARVGVITGVGQTNGSSRCVLKPGSGKWRRVEGRAVVPIPYGAQSLTIGDEVITDFGLDGGQGWYLVDGFDYGVNKTLVLSLDDVQYIANLIGGVPGLLFYVR